MTPGETAGLRGPYGPGDQQEVWLSLLAGKAKRETPVEGGEQHIQQGEKGCVPTRTAQNGRGRNRSWITSTSRHRISEHAERAGRETIPTSKLEAET